MRTARTATYTQMTPQEQSAFRSEHVQSLRQHKVEFPPQLQQLCIQQHKFWLPRCPEENNPSEGLQFLVKEWHPW